MKIKNIKFSARGKPKFSGIAVIFALILLFGVSIVSVGSISAQSAKGKIAGKVVDAETGDPMMFANIKIDGTSMGAASDLNGSFTIHTVPPGAYTLIIKYMGYADTKVTGVNVVAGQTTPVNASLKPEIIESEEVVVTAKALRNTEAVLLKDRQKSLAISDAVSAEAISRAGSGNAAEAMKQITGASVVDGKYVYVRGLGDRYTSTQLNGAEIPSTDPYKRAGSIDLIPSNLVDNIVTVKTFTPDKPGNFSGGTVDIKTKDFPENLDVTFSTLTSYNTQTTFSDNGIGYDGGKIDWLGIDDGKRALPANIKSNGLPEIPSNYDPSVLDQIADYSRGFNSQMTPTKHTPGLNQGYSFSLGNQITVLNRPLGFLGSLTYSNTSSSYDNGEYNAWNLGSKEAKQLSSIFKMNDIKTTNEVLWGGLLKASYKITPQNILSLNFIYNVNGESSARYLEGQYDYDKLDDVDDLFQSSIIGYNERRLSSLQFNGEHRFAELFNARLSWNASVSNSTQDEPDIRYFTRYNMVEDGEITDVGTFTNIAPTRLFRYLDENNKNLSYDFSIPFKQWSGRSSTLKFGSLISQKDRNFNERRFVYNYGSGSEAYDGNPDQFFAADNIGWKSTSQTINGVTYYGYEMKLYLTESDINANDYTADQMITAHYTMIDLPLMSKLRFIGGARYEKTNINLVSLDPTKENGKISTEDILPSVNLIYNVQKNMNVRTSYTLTLARPNFRELAPYATYDFSAGFTHIGNPNLKRTLIDNYDVRWEWFSRPGEIYAVSAFYKKFENPIERAFIVEATNREITWENVDNAIAMGFELEARKRLDVIHSSLNNFLLGANVSFVKSEVDIAEKEYQLMKRNNPELEKTRELEGQSPYLLNINFSYDNVQNGIAASLYYNIFGARLSEVNKSGEPYVYEQPAGTLNASFNWKFSSHLKLKFAVKNIFDSQFKKTQVYKDREYIFKMFNKGKSFSIGLGYSL